MQTNSAWVIFEGDINEIKGCLCGIDGDKQ